VRRVSVTTTERPYFTFVVPAHNESSGIEATVRSLLSVEYPRDRFAVLVVADNCSDNTAQLASVAGARVLVRQNATQRGKGYALELAFETLLQEDRTNAVVVVDADTEVSPNILMRAAIAMAEGASVMQAHYAVKNVDESWRTRLMDIAFTLYHGVRSHARERLRLSTGLRGNGMVFTIETLRRVPYRAYSLVEDVEYGIELGLNHIRVVYLGNTEVRAEMVASDDASVSQRKRWEQGRRQLLVNFVPKLLYRGAVERDWVLLDLAIDVLTPPLATVVVYSLGGMVVAAGAVGLGFSTPIVLIPWGASIASLAAYVGSGIIMSNRGASVVRDLAHAPRYVFWKMSHKWRSKPVDQSEWVRTARKGEPS
jgi:cellulose synthase/poly-beta-1,6-N-acetylglucosamine synthase-like glycosyltransferase